MSIDSNNAVSDSDDHVSVVEFMSFLGEKWDVKPGSEHVSTPSDHVEESKKDTDPHPQADKEEEGKHSESKVDNITKHDEDEEDDSSFITKPYSFSAMTEVESVERKIRQVARLSAANGVDVEKLFLKFDKFRSGSIRTTEFMEILTSMGMYILENSKVTESLAGDNSDLDDVKKAQLHQISNLRKNYENNAVNSAKKLISDKDNQLRRSDFKVYHIS